MSSKEIFERPTWGKSITEAYEHQLTLRYPDESDSESESELNLKPERYPGADKVFRIPEVSLIIIKELAEEEENLLKYLTINKVWESTIKKYLPKFYNKISSLYKLQEETLNLFLDLIQTSPGTRVFLKEKSALNLKGGRIAKQICKITGITKKEYQKDLKIVNVRKKEFITNRFIQESDNTDPKYFD